MSELICAECGTALAEGVDRVTADDRTFCAPCYHNLKAQLQQVVALQGSDINYSLALAGALVGAAAGVAAWWAFTVVTNIAFGLVAVVIGYAVGKGTVLAVGGRRARGLQILSVSVATPAYVYATYLVNRTFILRELAEKGRTDFALPWLPEPALFLQVVQASFGVMDLVFLALVILQAWRMPAPLTLAAH